MRNQGNSPEQPKNGLEGVKVFLRNMLTGGVSASVAVTAMAPVERIKLILQVQYATKNYKAEPYYKGLADALVRIPREQGIMSFWRGNLASVVRGFPYQALNFAFRDKFKAYFGQDLDKKGQFWRRLSGNLAAGGLAGSAAMTLIYPLDYARTRMAMDLGRKKETREFRSIRHCIKEGYREAGIRGVYRGFTFSLFGVFIYRSSYFGLFDTSKEFLNERDLRPSLLMSFVLAEAAATTSGLISYPFDTVRRSMMMMSSEVGSKHHYTSSFNCMQKLFARKGLRGFYNGAFTNVLRGTGGAIMLVLYDEIQDKLWKRTSIHD